MVKKWWATRHVAGGPWIPTKWITLFGCPFSTVWFKNVGPFETEEEAKKTCDVINETVDLALVLKAREESERQ